jgi:LTXXQ motif family protein
MIAANTIPALELPTTRILPTRRRVRSGAAGHLASLKAQLGITEDQSRTWAKFAATLSANRRTMQRNEMKDPFGRVEDRLVALGSMRRAAGELFSVRRVDQQCKALQLLPLCCLPQPA